MDAAAPPRIPHRRSFLWMSLLFSITHACCTTPLVLATSLLDNRNGSVGNGVLYVSSILCGMLVSVQLLRAVGIKAGLLVAMASFCLYEGCFTIALLLGGGADTLWLFDVAGSLCGGLASGVGWVAQGSYFSRSATLVADAEGVPRESATSELANTFAALYLTCEVLARVVFSLLQRAPLAPFWIGVIYFCVSLVALVALSHINSITMDPSGVNAGWFTKSLRCIWLWRNPHVWLLSSMNFTFGFSAAVMNGYVNSHFARKDLVGFLCAITCASAALFTLGHRPMAMRYGKGVCLFVGSASFFLLALVLLLLKKNRGLGYDVIVLYLLQGSGRAVYESTNKAVFADAFVGSDIEGAFANCFLQQAVAGAVCFFCQAAAVRDSHMYVAVLVLAASVLPMYCASIFLRRGTPEGAPLMPKMAPK